jgi:nicotinamide riboside kinase
MKTKIINFVGGAGIGKSTMAALTFAELKSMHFKTEYVQEYAKMLVYKREFETLDNQYLVSSEQYKMLKAVDGQVEYICSDSPLIIGLFYNRDYDTNVCNVEKTEAMILSKIKEFDNIYIYLERNNEYPFEKEGRVHDEEQSIAIDTKLKKLLDEFNIKYLSILSDKKSLPEIINYIITSSSSP